VIALLTSETLEMINVGPGSHDHLKGRDDLVACGAVAGRSEQPGIKEPFLAFGEVVTWP